MDTTIDRGNYVMLVLLNLSAAVETINHDHFLYTLEICRNLCKCSKNNEVIFYKSYSACSD